MILTPVAQAFQSADAKARAQAVVELRNLSGSPLGWNRAGQETILTLKGDGSLEFFRRGDFGERGAKPPGLWRGACDASEVEAVWRALDGLGPEAFPGRAADPGETVTQLQVQCAGMVGVLTYGPGEIGVARPGVDALAPLRRLMAKAQKDLIWNLALTQGGVARTRGGLAIPLDFSNDGSDTVRFLLSAQGGAAGMFFRYAVDEDDGSGTPPLSIEWIPAEVLLPQEPALRMAALRSGDSLRVMASIPFGPSDPLGPDGSAGIAPGGRYLGHFTYSQLSLGDRVAGAHVFAGMAFSDMFKFTVPA